MPDTPLKQFLDALKAMGIREGSGRNDYFIVDDEDEVTVVLGAGYNFADRINFHFTRDGQFKEHGVH